MKKAILFLALMVVGSLSYQAMAAAPGIGKLLTMFTGSLSSGAFTDAWNNGGKKEFTQKVKNNENMPVVRDQLSNLVTNYMTESAFTSGWQAAKSKWLSNNKAANTVQTVAGSLLNLQQYINPSMFGPKWTKVQPVFESGLKALAS